MESAMLSRPHLIIIAEHAGRYGLPLVFLAVMICLMSVGPGLWAQGNPASTGAAGPAAIKIEVLDVTTGSGSQAVDSGNQGADPATIKIEVLDVATGSGSQAVDSGNQGADPTVAPSVEMGPEKAPARPATGTGQSKAAKDPAEVKREALLAALERWHYDILVSYNYDINRLADPFMPIPDVRGQPPVMVDEAEEAKLPPLLRLELNQLKLVAITTLPGRQQGAIVSFEDGTGSSYILRLGDRIGRNHGRITAINANEVWVEERGRSGNDAPKTSVLRLNTLDTQGLTRGASGASGSLQTLSVPGD